MALRHLLLTILLIVSAHSESNIHSFKACQLKYQVSSVTIDGSQALAVGKNYLLYYSKTPPKEGLLKRDPFLGLNLVRSSKSFKHVFKFYNNKPKHLAAVLPETVVKGSIVSPQIGLNQLAGFSHPVKPNAMVSGTCCGIVALSTGEGLIDKEYIQHFLESKEVVYADIGIRVKDDRGVRVIEVNPFFEDSPFLLDDVILSMDDHPAINAADISKRILFSKVGSEHSFVVLRDQKKQELNTTFRQRLSGGLVPESFFDLFGLALNEQLVAIEDDAKLEIKKGDKLLYVMGKKVDTLKDIRRVLSEEKGSDKKSIVLLFQRQGFDFFIHFPKP